MTEFPSPREVPGGVVFREVMDREFLFVWNALRRFGVRRDDLSDQVQEVFLTVYQLFDDYDRARPLRPWLFAIVYRIAARYRVRLRKEPESIESLEEPASEGHPEEEVAQRQKQALALSAIQHIELGRRAVFIMHDVEGYAMPEVADSLGLPLNTAYSRLRLARGEFRSAVLRLSSERFTR